MFAHLDQFERADLVQVALPWIQRLGPKKRRLILSDAARSFRAWMMSRADKTGKVQVFQPTPTLGLLAQQDKPITRLVPMRKAKPWQCAGLTVSDYIGLAFLLWLSPKNPFQDVLSHYGVAEVFATLTYRLHATASPNSLIRACGLLGQLAHGEAAAWRKVAFDAYAKLGKRSAQLEQAREKSRLNRPQQARLRRERAYQLAMDYRRAHPSAQTAEVIGHLKQFDDFKTWKSERTFSEAIQGTFAATLKALDTAPRR